MYGQERWKKNRLLFWRKNGEGCFKKEFTKKNLLEYDI